MTVKVLVAEDEAPARRHIEALIGATPDLELVGSAADGETAVSMIEDARPAAVFVDVRMPKLSGVDVLRRLSYQPMVVFTTAYDEYAVTAFELGAVDYLLKPFGEELFGRAAARLQDRFGVTSGASIPERLDTVRCVPLQRVFAREHDRLIPVELDQIQRLSAQREYTEIRGDGAAYLLRIAISEIEPQLDDATFVRVHRSHIVNLRLVEHVVSDSARRMTVVLRNGERIPVSRTGARRLRALAF